MDTHHNIAMNAPFAFASHAQFALLYGKKLHEEFCLRSSIQRVLRTTGFNNN